MNLKSYFLSVLAIFLFQIYNAKCEVILSSLILGGTVISSYFSWNFIKCKYSECCDDKYINFDMKKLEESFKQKMFGQPLVNEITNILKAHKKGLSNVTKKNKKALVLSLHGWSGVGKNFATTLVAEAIFKNGMQSKFVKVFMGKKDFDCSDLHKSQRELLTKIKEFVKECPISLIVFDEIHEMCPAVLDAIKPMLDHHHAVDGVDYRNAIFIFISNIGGQEIASKLLELYSQGVIRNDVEFHNFEPLLRRTAYNTGGFKNSMTIAQHLIDHYIPFLPLEQHHVQMCASAEFRNHGVHNPTEEMMSDALSVITYGPTEEQPIFANNGCKRFTKQIPYIIQKYKHKDEL